nr:NAC domain-containing protein 83-like [Ipomoea trifida]
MDNLSLLFPGIRFQPTDEELVFHYLHPKVFNSPLPAYIILEIDNVCKSDPWVLPDGERYFFSRRCSRATLSGYWKPTGKDKKIAVSGEAQSIVGMKKTLVFYTGKAPNGSKTDWIMHEYSLADAPQPEV